MSLKQLPKINSLSKNDAIKWETPTETLSRWDCGQVYANADQATITIYDQIGSDGWEEGVTAKRIAGALRTIGQKEVTVSINSPGGDFFEGIAIYNLLREHPHKVTVNVVGLAASAASIIAMAGDEVRIAKSGFLMIHNAWAFVVGNRNDMLDAAKVLEGFDGSMADLYATATGKDKKDISAMMDEETWLSGQQAVDSGFATGLLSSDEIADSTSADSPVTAAVRKIDRLLASQGLPRSERRELLSQIKGGKPGAATTATLDAGLLRGMSELTKTIRGEIR